MRESIDINLAGAIYSLRPTWGAYAAIESRTGQSIRALWFKFASGDVKLSEMVVILTEGMKAEDSSKNIGDQQAMRALFESGPWWDLEDGVSRKMVEYLEMLGWTPEQREKIKAEIEEEKKAKALSAKSSPSAPQNTD